MQGISWLAEELLASQEGLCSIELGAHPEPRGPLASRGTRGPTYTTGLLSSIDPTVLSTPSIYATHTDSAARFIIKVIKMNGPCHRHLRPQNRRHEDSTNTATFYISSFSFGGGGGGTWPLALSCPSVRPHGKTRLPRDRFSWHFTSYIFTKTCRRHWSLVKIGQK